MTTRFSLEGQVAVVTGASHGIGLAIAAALAESGARVWLTAPDGQQLRDAADCLRAQGHDVTVRVLDVLDPQACVAGIREIGAAEGGRLDILVNHVEDNAHNDLAQAYAVGRKLRAYYLLCREAARLMVPRQYGRIVNAGAALAIGSGEAATTDVPGAHGLAGMSRALAVELGASGITVNMLAPGYFAIDVPTSVAASPDGQAGVSRRIPLGRLGDAAEAGSVAAFMASKAAGYINGHVLVLDGGLTAAFMLPSDQA